MLVHWSWQVPKLLPLRVYFEECLQLVQSRASPGAHALCLSLLRDQQHVCLKQESCISKGHTATLCTRFLNTRIVRQEHKAVGTQTAPEPYVLGPNLPFSLHLQSIQNPIPAAPSPAYQVSGSGLRDRGWTYPEPSRKTCCAHHIQCLFPPRMGPAGPAGGQCDGGHQVTTAASAFVFQRAADSYHMQVLQEGAHQQHVHGWLLQELVPPGNQRQEQMERAASVPATGTQGRTCASFPQTCPWAGSSSLHLHFAWREEMGRKRGESRPRSKMMVVGTLSSGRVKTGRGTGGQGQRGMLEMKDSLLIPSPRKVHSYLKCNECTQNLCPNAHIRDIQNPLIFFFHLVIS